MTEIRSAGRHVPGITAWDPSAVFVLKSLLYPLAATASLAGSLWLAHEPFQHSYFLVAVIAFIATADLLDVAPLRHDRGRAASLGSLLNIATHWLVVVGFIWALITVSGMQDRVPAARADHVGGDHAGGAVAEPDRRAAARCGRRARFSRRSRRAVIIGHNDLGRMLGTGTGARSVAARRCARLLRRSQAGSRRRRRADRRRVAPAAVHPSQRRADRLHHVGDDARGAHPRAAGDAARLDCVDLLRAGRFRREPDPGARGFRERHSRRGRVRVAVLRRARAREAPVRRDRVGHGDRDVVAGAARLW